MWVNFLSALSSSIFFTVDQKQLCPMEANKASPQFFGHCLSLWHDEYWSLIPFICENLQATGMMHFVCTSAWFPILKLSTLLSYPCVALDQHGRICYLSNVTIYSKHQLQFEMPKISKSNIKNVFCYFSSLGGEGHSSGCISSS